MEKDLLCAVLFREKICLLCINFRGNFLKYLLCVGVKSECSKRPQSVRLDGCCQQHNHKKSCNWPIINTELEKNYVQVTSGIWFKPTKVKKFRHQGETPLLCQIALTYDVCVVSATESTEGCQVWSLGPSLPNKENSVLVTAMPSLKKHVSKFFHLRLFYRPINFSLTKFIMTFRLDIYYLALCYLAVPTVTIKAICLAPCLKIQKCLN